MGISSFILIFTFQILFEGNFDNKDEAYDDYWRVRYDLGVIKGISIMIVSFGFQQNLFPMYNSLGVQNNVNCLAACKGALITTSIIYVLVAVLGVFFFGSVVD